MPSKTVHGARMVGRSRIPQKKPSIKAGQVSKRVTKPNKSSKKVATHSKTDEQIDTSALDLAWSALSQSKGRRAADHQIMEFYSRPRLVPMAASFGMTGQISLDLVHGWNGLDPEHQALACRLLGQLRPQFLMCSPPCTFFSPLMKMWNFRRMSAPDIRRRKKAAVGMVEQAVDSCLAQHRSGRYFAFEHPIRATSWEITSLRKRVATSGTFVVNFDQCQVDLVSPLGQPMQKRTRIWTNSPGVVAMFESKQCTCICEHRRIEGSELGHSLSKWAQTYPPKMVKCLLQGVSRDIQP